ncbi:MAG: type IV pilus assembly protein PilM [bacterium]|nr:type IV pilus assembly protein PilM [bacterium]
MWPFSRKIRRQLGVDVGTSSIKIVELEKEDNLIKLANYGLISDSDFFGEITNGSSIPSGLKVAEGDVSALIKQLLEKTKIKADTAVMSIPIFSSFLTVMELPNLDKKELESAVPFEARSYIPVPLSEVVLDWIVLPHEETTTALKAGEAPVGVNQNRPEKIMVLLIAVPKEVVSKYQRIAVGAGLKLASLESESFSLARSLAGGDPSSIMLVDMGARSSNLTILHKGFIFMSHSADLSGKELTKIIGHSLNVDTKRAEELKKGSGVAMAASDKGLAQVIGPFVDRLVSEIERMESIFSKKENRKIDKIILTGGTANMPGMAEYLSKKLGVVVTVGNPLGKIKYEAVLEQTLRRELGSNLAVSIGLAMRGL